MTEEQERVIDAKLSAQRALLGEVPAALRAVLLSVEKSSIKARCYFDGPIDPEDAESMSCAETEMMADYAPEVEVRFECIRRDAPEPITDPGVWVYARRERTS
jgi:hypothetical protein